MLAGELDERGLRLWAAAEAESQGRGGIAAAAGAGLGPAGEREDAQGRRLPDRDAQFRHINATVKPALAAGEPTISVDTKEGVRLSVCQGSRSPKWILNESRAALQL